MRLLLQFSRAIDTVSERMGGLASIFVILTIAAGFYNVVARYVGYYVGLKLASNGLLELQWYFYSIVFFLGFAAILRHDVNVRVDFLYANWSPKRRAWINLIGTLLFLIPFCILGIYVTINPVLASWGRLPGGAWGAWEMSPDPDGLPRAPIKSFIIIAFVALLLQAISQVIKYIAIITGHTEVTETIRADTEGQGPVG
jgi:TRAP-type mannitol/chloroaromatic compound transport system permease small subunit